MVDWNRTLACRPLGRREIEKLFSEPSRFLDLDPAR
jgi:hypothetical protein